MFKDPKEWKPKKKLRLFGNLKMQSEKKNYSGMSGTGRERGSLWTMVEWMNG